MAFMDHNREINGAPSPRDIGREGARRQSDEDTLTPNPTDLGAPQKRTFEPNLETEEAINRRHYRGGLDESQWPDYEHMIPNGPSMGR